MNIFSFFSGAGFLDLGFELQGHYNIVFVNEFHEAFNRIYRYARQNIGIAEPRYGHHVEDITEYVDGTHEDKMQRLLGWVEESKEEELTGFIGGPPCPDFSVAGKNRGRDGENGKLSETYARLICTALPDFFLFENVKGLYRTARHRAFFEELKQQFRDNRYCLTEQLVNSLEFGAPQDRDRIILIGVRQNIADRLNLKTDNGCLADFPWIDYLKRINALLEGTPFKLGYRAANEALIYLQASKEFSQTDRTAALDNFTLMKILSRIEGDETKLKITDSEADKERIANAGVNVDTAKRYGDLNILTALRNIITEQLGETINTDVDSDATEETATENDDEIVSTEQNKKDLLSVKKIDSMLSQLKRDHFVSFWN